MASRLPHEDVEEGDDGEDVVTAAALTRRQGYWFQRAATAPLPISHHGRLSHVLLSTERYNELTGKTVEPDVADGRRLLRMVVDRIGSPFIWLDETLGVRLMNAQAAAHFDIDPDVVIGESLMVLVPSLRDSLVYSRIKATVRRKEVHSADVPSLLSPGSWVHFDTFPLDGGAGVNFRIIDDEVREHRQADMRDAVIAGLRALAHTGYARMNIRGTIEHANDTLSAIVKLASDRLVGVPLVDLMSRSTRTTVRDALDHVLTHNAHQTLQAELMANDGRVVTVNIAIEPLSRQFGMEGAVAVVTTCGTD